MSNRSKRRQVRALQAFSTLASSTAPVKLSRRERGRLRKANGDVGALGTGALPELVPLPHPHHRIHNGSCRACGVGERDEAIREPCSAVTIKPLDIASTPEDFAAAHRFVTGHQANVSAWGAICACGAVWTRDPAKGGDGRRRPASGA